MTDQDNVTSMASHPSSQAPTPPGTTDDRESLFRSMHARVENDLIGLRYERDTLNAQIKVLVAEEDRLARMVRILDRAQESHEEADADPS